MNCALCKKKITTTFLQKIHGTHVRANGKQHIVCSECQKRLGPGLKDALPK